MPRVHIVYTHSAMLLDRRPYASWREIQDAYPDYMASLGPWAMDEILDFLGYDFGHESEWPFSRRQIEDFFRSGEDMLRRTFR